MPTKKTPSKTAAKTPVKTAAAKTSTGKAPAAKLTAAKLAAPAATAVLAEAESAVAAHQETLDGMMKAGTQAATKGYEQAIAIAQEQVEKASESLFKRYDEAATLSQENVEAYVRSTTVFAQGVEIVGKELMSFAQSAVETNVANTKALFGAKSVRELVDLQAEISRSGFDSLVAESAKLTELSLALANEALEPIQLRVNVTVEKLMKPIAA
ncbi:MAG: phasin family protein [Kiloniellaceae bacterium]